MAIPRPFPPRQVTLVLVRPDGALLGSLPPFDVDDPWWREAAPVVLRAHEEHGVDVTVLRLLESEPDRAPGGGSVTYLAETCSAPANLRPWLRAGTEQEPLRLPYAEPGGPARDLAWADARLSRLGTPRISAAQQVRTWNLSSLWRLPLADGVAWLKVVPPFYAHEGALLGRLHPDVVPTVIAADGSRLLMAEVPGEDLYTATGSTLLDMVRILVGLQEHWHTRADELVRLGLPDGRPGPFTEAAADVLERTAGQLDRNAVAVLNRFVAGLDERWSRIGACGIPDSLVHGDFHPGNLRGTDGRLVLLDWGDSGVGHPLLDQAAFMQRLLAHDRNAARSEWTTLWRRVVPGCHPERAARLLEPIGVLRQAAVYRRFLDRIEPSERVYHAADPAERLRRAAELARLSQDRV